MSDISERYAQYKAQNEGHTPPPAQEDISKRYAAFKKTATKPAAPGPLQTFGDIFAQVYTGSEAPEYTQEGAKKTVEMLPKALPVAGMLAGGAAAGAVTGGMGAIPALFTTAGMVGAGGALGKAAEMKIEAGKVSGAEVAKEAALGAGLEALFGGLGITAKAVKNYVVNSPRVLDTIADILSGVTRGEYTASNIKTSLERAGVAPVLASAQERAEAIKFAPRGKGNIAMEPVNVVAKDGAAKLAEVQAGLKEMRELAGKEVANVDAKLVEIARHKNANLIDLSPIIKDLDNTILKIENNPVLSEAVNLSKLKKIAAKLRKSPDMAIDDAIETKRLISDIFEDFGNRGVMAIDDAPIVTKSMANARVKLKEAIAQKAKDLGVTEFDNVYKKFGEFADNYDIEFLPMFGSKEGKKFLEDRFISLSNEITRRGNILENIEQSGKLLFPGANAEQVSKGISELTDLLLVRSILQDIGHAPSDTIVGLARKLVVQPMAPAFIKAANISQVGKAIAPMAATELAPIVRFANMSAHEIKERYKQDSTALDNMVTEGKIDQATATTLKAQFRSISAEALRQYHGYK